MVLGLGNPLLGDDGVGIEALGELERGYLLPGDIDLLDGGTMGLLLLDRVEGYDRLLIADSVTWGGSPGEIVRLDGEAVPAAFSASLSPHQTGANDLLAALTLLGRLPEQLVVIGMAPGCLEPGIGLSEPVRRGLERMVDAMAATLREWGLAPRRRVLPSGSRQSA